ncbi:MAG TPA: FAD-dependent oxidoreductase, partial [Clostridiales bacterium]|nr:FAD-dependent oxidoreductase [Clostridiales bacterium]
IYLSRYAKKVYLIHRRNEFRGSKTLQDRVFEKDNIEVIWNGIVTDILADDKVKGIIVQDVLSKEETRLEVDGLFVAIGIVPNNELVQGKVEMTESGFIISDENMRTSEDGVFVAGDLRQKPLRQLITAAADGALAATSAQDYVVKAFS